VVPELRALGTLVPAAVDVGALALRRYLGEVLVDVHRAVVGVEVVLVADKVLDVLDPGRVSDQRVEGFEFVDLLELDRLAADARLGAALDVTVPLAGRQR